MKAPLILVLTLLPTLAALSSRRDIDGDGILNRVDLDVDNDGTPNVFDRNIDGGKARSGPERRTFVGDRKANTADVDRDGDLRVNGRDADMDGDGVRNAIDPDNDSDGLPDGYTLDVDRPFERDLDGDRAPDTVDFTDDLGNGVFLAGTPEVEEKRAAVTAALTAALKFNPNQARLTVAVDSLGGGTWNLFTIDGIAINGSWGADPANPGGFRLFRSNMPDEQRVIAQFPNGVQTFYSWQPGKPVGYFVFPNDALTNDPAVLAALDEYFASLPNVDRRDDGYVTYSGDFATTFQGVAPILLQQRILYTIAKLVQR